MSPYNRDMNVPVEPFIQDTRQAIVLRSSLIVVRNKASLGFQLPAGKNIIIPDLSAYKSSYESMTATLDLSPDNAREE